MDDKQKIFLECFSPLKDRLWRFCLYLSNDREAAKDLLQDTIEAAYLHFESVRHREAFLSYLFTVASRNYYRTKRLNSRFEPFDERAAETLVDDTVSPETKVEIALFYKALDKLSPEAKEAIILTDIMGFPRKEVCDIQSVNLETLKARLYRGRKKLAQLLGVDDDTTGSEERVFALSTEGERK